MPQCAAGGLERLVKIARVDGAADELFQEGQIVELVSFRKSLHLVEHAFHPYAVTTLTTFTTFMPKKVVNVVNVVRS